PRMRRRKPTHPRQTTRRTPAKNHPQRQTSRRRTTLRRVLGQTRTRNRRTATPATPATPQQRRRMSQPYATLDDRPIIRDAQTGRIRHTETGVNLHTRADGKLPVRVDLTRHITAGWLQLHPDQHWRPTPLGAAIAGINT